MIFFTWHVHALAVHSYQPEKKWSRISLFLTTILLTKVYCNGRFFARILLAWWGPRRRRTLRWTFRCPSPWLASSWRAWAPPCSASSCSRCGRRSRRRCSGVIYNLFLMGNGYVKKIIPGCRRGTALWRTSGDSSQEALNQKKETKKSKMSERGQIFKLYPGPAPARARFRICGGASSRPTCWPSPLGTAGRRRSASGRRSRSRAAWAQGRGGRRGRESQRGLRKIYTLCIFPHQVTKHTSMYFFYHFTRNNMCC